MEASFALANLHASCGRQGYCHPSPRMSRQMSYNMSHQAALSDWQSHKQYARSTLSGTHHPAQDTSVSTKTGRHRVPFHCGALLMCGLMWIMLFWMIQLVWQSTLPAIVSVSDSVLRTINGEVTVTCRMGDLPLNHLRCMLFLRLTNWLHWTISGVSRYLGGLEDPWDMFCFLCTTLGGLYVTCSTMVRGIGQSMMRTAYWASIKVYRGTYDCLNNPLSPFGYIESSLTLTE